MEEIEVKSGKEDSVVDEEIEMEVLEDVSSPEPVTSFEGMDVVFEDEDREQIELLRRQVSFSKQI